jgi:hypothetical protein
MRTNQEHPEQNIEHRKTPRWLADWRHLPQKAASERLI